MDKKSTVIVIPARLESTRLPQKPLADINGKAMIQRVWEKAAGAAIADVLVACDSMEISRVIEGAGGRAVLTDPNLPSGSDRIAEALSLVDPQKNYKTVINLQGDMPDIDMRIVADTLSLFHHEETADIATAAYLLEDKAEQVKPNNVKVVISGVTNRALYFSRALVPYGTGEIYCHIGLYIYRREALEKFVKLPPSKLETLEKLEQLRALENGMNIAVKIVDKAPISVDTLEDLERARSIIR